MTSVRLAAARILIEVDDRQTTLAAAVDAERRDLPDSRDRALLLELTSGVLRWRNQLDALLAPCVSRPFGEINLALQYVLRLAAYQLEHLTRVPAHAIVHESVELARDLGHARATGFVNAALRAWPRTRPRVRLPEKPVDPADRSGWIAYLSTTLSHPAWLAARWFDRHGPEAAATWCTFNNLSPAVTVRPYDHREHDAIAAAFALHEVAATAGRFATDAWSLPPGAWSTLPPDVRHQLFVQDEAAQVVAHVAGARPRECVLDVCAAPGGKSLVLAADMDREGLLISADARQRRLRVLRKTLRRATLPPRLVHLDARRPLPFGPTFDRVLVDAPCTGLGILSRDPDLKWARTEEEFPRFAEIEARILAAGADAVRPGGHLIYATCSGEPEENDDVVEAFLARREDFARVTIGSHADVPRLGELVNGRGDFQTWPFAHGLDAFFAALLVRREGA